jgi:hypothetical protein
LILPNVPLGRHEVLAAVTCGDLKKEYRMTIVVQVAAAVGAGAVVQRCLLAPLAPAPARPGLCPARCRTAHGVRRGNAPGQGPIAMQCHERLRARGCLRWCGLLCSALRSACGCAMLCSHPRRGRLKTLMKTGTLRTCRPGRGTREEDGD